MLALRSCPAFVHVPAHERGVNRQKRVAHCLREFEIVTEIRAVVIIVKNAPDTARFAAMFQEEILIAPA